VTRTLCRRTLTPLPLSLTWKPWGPRRRVRSSPPPIPSKARRTTPPSPAPKAGMRSLTRRAIPSPGLLTRAIRCMPAANWLSPPSAKAAWCPTTATCGQTTKPAPPARCQPTRWRPRWSVSLGKVISPTLRRMKVAQR